MLRVVASIWAEEAVAIPRVKSEPEIHSTRSPSVVMGGLVGLGAYLSQQARCAGWYTHTLQAFSPCGLALGTVRRYCIEEARRGAAPASAHTNQWLCRKEKFLFFPKELRSV